MKTAPPRLCPLLLCLTLAVGLAPACADSSSDGDGSTAGGLPAGKGDLYGADDRVERFAADASWRALADATALVATRGALQIGAGDTARLSTTSWSDKMARTLGGPLCEDEPYREQPAPGHCSAFLIAPDLVATAGHCINLKTPCGETRFVFGFAYAASTDEPGVVSVPWDDVYQCAAVVGHLYDQDAVSLQDLISRELWSDWAVVQLDRPVTDRTPLPLRREGGLADGAALAAIGHPGGIPSKVTGGRVTDASHQLYYNTDLDIYSGNSGSVVVGSSGLAEGIVIRGTGGASFVEDGGCFRSRQCAEFDATSGSGCTGNHVMRIEPVLAFLDAEQIVMEGTGLDADIPDGAGSATGSVTVSEAGAIRFVTLNVGIQHGNPRELRVTLERDGGGAVQLFDGLKLHPAGEAIFSRTTAEFDGELAAGTWRVRVEDTVESGATYQSLWFMQIVIGIGEPHDPGPAATFIGSPCLEDAECGFDATAACSRFGADGDALGYCVLPCAGYCPDCPGFATTFCTSLDDGLTGACVPRSHALNGQCQWLPGTTPTDAERFLGGSAASPATREVCLP